MKGLCLKFCVRFGQFIYTKVKLEVAVMGDLCLKNACFFLLLLVRVNPSVSCFYFMKLMVVYQIPLMLMPQTEW